MISFLRKRAASTKESEAGEIDKRGALSWPRFLLALAGLGAGIGLLSLIMGSAARSATVFFAYFTSPLVIVLNIVPPVLLVLLVYFLTGRAWLGYTIPGVLILALSLINYFKLLIRGDPLYAEDLVLVGEAGSMLKTYTLPFHWIIIIVVMLFVAGVYVSAHVLKGPHFRWPRRYIGAGIVTAVSAALYLLVYTSGGVYSLAAPPGAPLPFSDAYIARGMVYPFLHSIGKKTEPPEGYSDEVALEVLEGVLEEVVPVAEDNGIIPDDRKVNVISIMLESYSDLSRFPQLEFAVDVYGPLHTLQNESVSGSLIVNTFAGGTIDTERLFLTGYTKLDRYSGPVNSFVHYLRSQGYATEGLHTGDRWFYDRETVNAWLGFEQYFFLEDYENGERTDAFMFPEILNLYRTRDKSKPYFSYNLSYQNHGQYPGDWTEEPYYIKTEGLSDLAVNTINNYLTGIYDTNIRLAAFIDEFRDDPDPVVIVVFGDHMPLLGTSEAVYRELGINVDTTTTVGFYNLYSTPYFIWANDAAKEMLDAEFVGDGGSFSPCYLMAKLFDLCSWTGDEYMRVLRELCSQVDVINTPTGIYREFGRLTHTLTKRTGSFYEDFLKIEYYRLQNFVYENEEVDHAG